MSACHTCKGQMPNRIVIHVDGATYNHDIPPDKKVEALQKAVNYLLGLIDKEAQAKHG